MKKIFLFLLVLCTSIALHAQTENPFAKFGYDVLTASSSKGEFEEFHDQADIAEIGSILFNTTTNEIVKVLEKDETTIDLSSAITAMSIDPQCEKYYWISPYAYCANNPIKYVDPTGEFIESAWDMFSLVTGAKSFVDNVKAGNVGAAIVDGLGVVVDAAAVVLPGVPGGVGAAAKGVRAMDKAIDATRAVDKATDAAKVGKYSDIPNPKNAGPGKKTTPSQRQKILEKNKELNNGELRSDGDGRLLNTPSKNTKGQKADMNQAEIDHIEPKSKGGSNENSNMQVLSKEENLKKGNR